MRFNHWDYPNTGATNECGFNAMGSGLRATSFIQLKQYTYYLTTNTLPYSGLLALYNSNNRAIEYSNGDPTFGMSIRLIIDSPIEIDGNSAIYVGNDLRRYKCVLINRIWWLAENLMETRYRNGDLIPIVTDDTEWSALITGARCSYNNDESNAITTVSIAPVGWHVSSDAEWSLLVTFLGGESVAGGKLKEIGTLHWQTPNTGATNEVGFNGSGGGYRGGNFSVIKYYGDYLTSTISGSGTFWNRNIGFNGININRGSGTYSIGMSLRLIKDDSTDPGTLADIDGNVYKTVKIGNQIWTASNWKCTKYNDGTPIPNITDNAAWSALTTSAWCVYDNDINNK
jgi:uncharacterized protein (TIGR02145 family)